ncbi:hypothetical protein NUACC21_67740 [Scytonema sp. NUACC21]
MTNSNKFSNSLPREEIIKFMSDYFSQRGPFLAKVIRADFQSLSHLTNFSGTTIYQDNSKNKRKKDFTTTVVNKSSSKAKVADSTVIPKTGNARNESIAPHNGTITNQSNRQTEVGETANTRVIQTSSLAQTTPDIYAILVDLVIQQTGYPKESIVPEARLLDDLNLDSIKASELIATVAKKCNVAGKIDPSTLNNATLKEIATVIESSILVEKETQPTLVPTQSLSVVSPQGLTSPQESINLPELLFKLVEEQTGFSRETLSLNLRLLDDLNLDSIKASELVANAARQFGIGGQLDPSKLANATLSEIITALEQVKAPQSQKTTQNPTSTKPFKASTAKSQDILNWVRNFAVEYVPQEAPPRNAENWSEAKILIVSDFLENSIVSVLEERFLSNGAQVAKTTYQQIQSNNSFLSTNFSHYLALLPQTSSQLEQQSLPLTAMVERLKSIATPPKRDTNTCVAYVQFGGGYFGSGVQAISPEVSCGAAFARSLHLERPDLRVRVVDLAQEIDPARAADLVLSELSSTEAIVTVGYNASLVRLVPQHRLQQPNHYQKRSLSWSEDDVILITGGAKGITAECALALAQSTGVKMALVGSSPVPTNNESEISRTLERLTQQNLTCRYYSCDITNPDAVFQLVETIKAELGTITGVIHGAGLNKPRRVEQVSLDDAVIEVSPKLKGAYNLLQALSSTPPKLAIAFSSIIGVTGMPGNAWYAFANESLAILLDSFTNKHPETSVLSLAYSVWGEVGMGARMGSVKNLERMGIGAISTHEGVTRFLKLFECDPGVQQVVIAAKLGELDTWSPPALPQSQGLRFVERVLYVEPGVELIARTHLSLERDLYVQDHVWRGSYLFPTVFGLEAMAQATAYVTGNRQLSIVRLENISLRRPVVVHPTEGTEIELRAEVMEADANGEKRVKVGIRTEQSGFATDHFAATLVLGELKLEQTTAPQLEQPLTIDPQTDLYGNLLFQGQRFQRMGSIFSLNEKSSVFRSYTLCEADLIKNSFGEDGDSCILLGDPYFRDVLLQSVQLTIPKHICLPVQIDKIELFQNPNLDNLSRVVTVNLQTREENEYISEVVTTDEQGCVLERITGYRLRILEEHPENPTAVELACPNERDRSHFLQVIDETFKKFNLQKPAVVIEYTPGLHTKLKEQRHQQEKPIIIRALKAKLGLTQKEEVTVEIETLSSGKPRFTGTSTAGLDLSISHCDRYCLCVVGEASQGCDIEAIPHKSEEDWIALLSFSRFSIVNELVQSGDTQDQAATRVWSASEAICKAFNGITPEFSVVKRLGNGVLLKTPTPDGDYYIVTVPIKLTRPPERMIAIVVPPPQEKANVLLERSLALTTTQPNSQGIVYSKNNLQGQPVLEQHFQVSLKESASISHHVYFSQYFNWIGKIRELPMKSIASQMLSDFLDGQWSLMTKVVSLRVVGEATSYDAIQARCWLGNVIGSSFDTYMEFCKVLPNKSLERLAIAEVKATWVYRMTDGIPPSSTFPWYFKEYLQQFGAEKPVTLDLKQPSIPSLPALPASLSQLNSGRIIYSASQESNRCGKLLKSEVFQTTLEDSNVVGNVYYSNYFVWQGRILDLFLYSVAPEYLQASNPNGEMICLYSHINYLREAMPFDKIRVLLYVESVSECGAKFNFEFFREQGDNNVEKLHIGQQEVIWVKRLSDGTPVATPWPTSMLHALTEARSLNQVSVLVSSSRAN